jgi:hypothetical protein
MKELVMKTHLLVFSVLVLASLCCLQSLAAQAVIPAGTVLPVVLDSSMDARSSKPGQLLTAKIMQDVQLNHSAKLKAGTRVLGKVLAVTPASSSAPATLALHFDRIEGQATPIWIGLRALASPLEVKQAETQISGYDRNVPPPWGQTLTQIGGDVVYRGEGKVLRGLELVGTSVYAGGWGVLSRVSSNSEGNCPGPVEGNNKPQALWVFSHDACGIYGYEAIITDAGRANAEGKIVLASVTGDLKIRKGSGMLLQVNSAEPARK